MIDLPESDTLRNLEAAFARESQAAIRYRLFAQRADIDGEPEVAARFRSLADGATGHALGHLELLIEHADPATGGPVDDVDGMVSSARQGERADHEDRYPNIASVADQEGFVEIAAWLRAVARADHVDRLHFG